MLHAIMTSCFSIRVTTQNIFIGIVNEFNFSSITPDQDQIGFLIRMKLSHFIFLVLKLHRMDFPKCTTHAHYHAISECD